MNLIISYLAAFLLLVFDLICIHSKYRVSILGRVLIFFIPLANIAFETIFLTISMCRVGIEMDNVLNDNKITRWLFNGAEESVFYHN